ncbi:MAG: hypothetical protein K2P43_00660 [Lachnospiraceae bacterium]|nr:hypothetical protein [Lachnospiraceae bacterium]
MLLPADEYPPLLFAYPVFCCCTVCFAELAQKIRDLFGNIFEPFRQAWELEGKNTIEAAEYAFSSLKTLAESVGASLMEVWTNGTETKTVTLLLEILQNVLLTVGHIADRRNGHGTPVESGRRSYRICLICSISFWKQSGRLPEPRQNERQHMTLPRFSSRSMDCWKP